MRESGQTRKKQQQQKKTMSTSYQLIDLPTMQIHDIKNKTSRKDFDWLGTLDQELTIAKPEIQSLEKMN